MAGKEQKGTRLPTPNTGLIDARILPERIHPRGLVAFVQSHNPEKVAYTPVVQAAFSSLFYSNLWTPELVENLRDWIGEPLEHTVIATPHRKFKAVLPFLSLGCDQRVVKEVLAAEILFSLFYLHDDVIDNKFQRYGKATAFGVYGGEANINSWRRAHELGKEGREFLENEGNESLWVKILTELEDNQNKRVSVGLETTFQEYALQSMKRTMFLGEWWQQAARKVNDTNFAEFIGNVYPYCALVGQLCNDLRNVSPQEFESGGIRFSDFTDGKVTSMTLLTLTDTRSDLSADDISWVKEKVWESGVPLTESEILKMEEICQSGGAVDSLRDIIRGIITVIENYIETSSLSPDVKTIWQGWVALQFKNGLIGHLDYANPEETENFINAFARLSSKTQH